MVPRDHALAAKDDPQAFLSQHAIFGDLAGSAPLVAAFGDALTGDIVVEEIDIAGSKPRVEDWLGVQIGEDLDGVKLSFNAPNGMPGLDAVVFNSPGRGVVRI